jgi:hypothetical protein
MVRDPHGSDPDFTLVGRYNRTPATVPATATSGTFGPGFYRTEKGYLAHRAPISSGEIRTAFGNKDPHTDPVLAGDMAAAGWVIP